MHEPTFRAALEEAGLNPYMLEMANIREQCSWVHEDPDGGHREGERAGRRCRVRRVRLHRELSRREFPGDTRRSWSSGAASPGSRLPRRSQPPANRYTWSSASPRIGGHMAMLDKTFPTLDCSACILTPKMVDVARYPNIEVLTIERGDRA